jgi:hypothetical protein
VSSRKLPRHVHTPEELGLADYSQTIPRDWLPQLDWARMAFETLADFIAKVGNIAWTYITKTASDVLSTIASWANMVTAFGNLAWGYVTKTAQNIMDTLVSWANMVSVWGNIAWSQITKTASDIMTTISTWANIIGQVGNLAWSYITATAANIMTTISSWANILSQVGAMTVLQITTTLTNWATLISGLGNVAWTYVTKTASDVMTTVSSWTNILSQVGAMTVGQILTALTSWTQMTSGSALGTFPIAKLDLPPYKLTTSAYNYVVNGGFEYGTWGGDEGWIPTATFAAKFGKYCIALYAVASNELSGYSNYIDIRGMDKVTLSAWITIWNRTAGTFQGVVWFYNSSKTLLSWTSWYETATTNFGWTQISHTYTPSTDFPTGTAYIRITFQWWAASSPYCTGDAYIDAVQINMGDQIPTFQDFTAYSYNWCPEKIETMLATELAWSNQTWTDILELGFECESTMLCMIFAHARGSIKKDSGTAEANAEYKLLLDDSDISGTFGWIGKVEMAPNEILRGCYSSHSVAIITKGTHTVKMQMIANIAGSTARAYDRRISILKGFYQGGAT